MEKDSKSKAKILVVDDEPRNVRLLSMRLKREGYEILQAYSGNEAIEKAKVELPDLIFLDIMMPQVSGYEVCEELRKRDETKAIPIVMITALRGLDEKIKALDIGADDFISKPFDSFEVLARARSLLRVKYLYDELEKRKKILEDELIMAREVQEALLPSDIETQMPPRLEVCYKYLPTLAVGGDFFDVVKISPGVIGIFIADVMGHGAQPALITVLIKTLLNELVHESQTPAELLTKLNRRYNDLVHHTGIFTTALYLIIDVNKSIVTFSNAGHPPPLLIRKNKHEFEELIEESSYALGFVEDYDYTNYERDLEKGDTILLYTDGLSDIANKQTGEVFDLDDLKSVVDTMLKETDVFKLPSAAIIQTILDAINEFAGDAEKPDDITILAVSFGGCRASC